MKIGELAKAAAVSRDTIRYYLEVGLLTATKDPHNGYQLFDAAAVQRLHFIKTAQGLGFRLEDIQIIFQDAEDARSPCPRVRDIIVRRMGEARQRIDELTRLCEQMEQALQSWERMPDELPDGRSICRLIESQANDLYAPD